MEFWSTSCAVHAHYQVASLGARPLDSSPGMAVVREGLLAALMSRRGREMQPPSLGGQKATQAGPPCR